MSHNALRPIPDSPAESRLAHFRMLGEFSITHAGKAHCQNFSKRRIARHLIQLLGTSDSLTASRSVVIESLWPNNPQDAVANRLHQTIHWIRGELKSLPSHVRPAIQVEGDQLSLQLPVDIRLDVQWVLQLYDSDQQDAERLTALREIIDLTRADLCPDWPDNEHIELRRQAFRKMRRDCLEEAVQLSEDLEPARATIDILDQLCLEPEVDLDHQMRLAKVLAQHGRIDRAIAFCLKVREQWKYEDPSEVAPINQLLTALQRQANTSEPKSKFASELQENSVRAKHETFYQFTSRRPAVGIDDVVNEVIYICQSSLGLVTAITGSHGCGKTTVASAATEQIQTEFRNGCIFLDCGDVKSKDELVQLLFGALQLNQCIDKPGDNDLKQAVRSTEALFFLDDLDASLALADFVAELSRANSENRWLITCQSIPSIPGARNYVISSTRMLTPFRSPTELLAQISDRRNSRLDLNEPECHGLQLSVCKVSELINELPDHLHHLIKRMAIREYWLTHDEILETSHQSSTQESDNSVIRALDTLVRLNLLVRGTEEIESNLVSVYRISFVARLAAAENQSANDAWVKKIDTTYDTNWLTEWPLKFSHVSTLAAANAFDRRIEEFDRIIRSVILVNRTDLVALVCQRFQAIWEYSHQKTRISEWLTIAYRLPALSDEQKIQLLICRASLSAPGDETSPAANDAVNALSIAHRTGDTKLVVQARQILARYAADDSPQSDPTGIKQGMQAGFKLLKIAQCATDRADHAAAASMLHDACLVFDSFGLHLCALTAQRARAEVALSCADLSTASVCADELEHMAATTGDRIHQLWADLIRVELSLVRADFQSTLVAATVLSGQADSCGADEIAWRAMRTMAWALFSMKAYRLCDETCERLINQSGNHYQSALTVDVLLLSALCSVHRGNMSSAMLKVDCAAQLVTQLELNRLGTGIHLVTAELSLSVNCDAIALSALQELEQIDEKLLTPYDQVRLESIRQSVGRDMGSGSMTTRTTRSGTGATRLLEALSQSVFKRPNEIADAA